MTNPTNESDVNLALVKIIERVIEWQRTTIEGVLAQTLQKDTEIMADISALQTEVANVVASEAAADAKLDVVGQKLIDLLATVGQAVPQEQIDALTSALSDARSALDSKVSTTDPDPTPPTTG